MTVEQAIELIFTRLCAAYTRNPDATLTAEDLGAGIPNDIFAAALRELRGPNDDQDLRLRYVEGNRTKAALARRGAASAKRGDGHEAARKHGGIVNDAGELVEAGGLVDAASSLRDVPPNRDGALAHERDRHRMGAHAVVCDAAGGVGGAQIRERRCLT